MRTQPNARHAAILMLAAGLLASLLAGCATPEPGTTASAAGTDIITASDESKGRKRARLRLELGIGYFQQGNTMVALDEVKQALLADPTYADAYNLRGLVYMRLDDPALAEDSFRRAIALRPNDPDTLHNYGWLLCQQKRYADAERQFDAALAVPSYRDAGKTLMAKGVCELQAGQRAEAERTLLQAYERDPGNPVVGYNLALLLYQRHDYARAQFYMRRINNGPSSNAESLWLGMKIERQLGNREALAQLATQLQGRFAQSREALAYERGDFND